jgi:hypothetical protein
MGVSAGEKHRFGRDACCPDNLRTYFRNGGILQVNIVNGIYESLDLPIGNRKASRIKGVKHPIGYAAVVVARKRRSNRRRDVSTAEANLEASVS